jgi:hypothetical protein
MALAAEDMEDKGNEPSSWLVPLLHFLDPRGGVVPRLVDLAAGGAERKLADGLCSCVALFGGYPSSFELACAARGVSCHEGRQTHSPPQALIRAR